MDKKTFGHDIRTITNTLNTLDVNIDMLENTLKNMKKLRVFAQERIDDIHAEAFEFIPEPVKKEKEVSNVQ